MLVTLHCQRHQDWQNAFARAVGSGWIKIVNPPTGRVLFPDVPRVLGRIWTDDVDGQYIREGREGGARFVRDMLPRWRAVPGISVWELANEPDCNSNDGLAALNNYTLGAIEEAERQALRLCILNLPEGNPSGEAGAIRWKWEQLLPCVRRAVQGGHYVGLHAYWRPGVEGPTGRYHALGRRKYDIAVLGALGVDTSRLRVLINETGIDGGIADGPPATGWQTLSDSTRYRAEIVEAEQFARTVPQVEALMFFTSGWEPPWESYNIESNFAFSLVAPLLALGHPEAPMTDVDLERILGDELQLHVVPLNPNAALEKAAARRGLIPASDEVRQTVAGTIWVTQAFRKPADALTTQYLVRTRDGQWAEENMRWWTRGN